MFYATQIVLAIGFLHSANIMYRDLKPENVLVDETGYIKLSDFGLSKRANFSNTFCGTPEYISPEILLGTGHDHTVDWWALGVLIYEMLTGVPPFYDKDRNAMFANIEQNEVRWPEKDKHGISVSPVAKDLISKLLAKDRKKRLGQVGDQAEILKHPFFRKVNPADVLQKKLQAPFIPAPRDLESVRALNKILLTELRESEISEKHKQLVSQLETQDALFEDFGLNIDLTREQRMQEVIHNRSK